jgi:Domain of unknown function (DUF4082)
MATYRLFPATDGPSAATAYTGPVVFGVVFEVTSGGTWLEGYWWWVCASGQSGAAQTFALWQLTSYGAGTLVTAATTNSATLTPGQWNYVPLPTPVALTSGITYLACTGFENNFPITNNQFGAGDPYSAGITNGPLTAFSDQSGSNREPFSTPQGCFTTATGDPTAGPPTQGWLSSNLWIDVQVTDQPPAGFSYRLWPNYPSIPGSISIDTGEQTSGTEFRLSQACTLDNIWFYSPPGVTVLPSRCAIWEVATQTVVPGTDDPAPTWSGAPGSGWVADAYRGVVLPPGDYKVSIYYEGGKTVYQENVDYFSSGPGANGITAGPLSTPNVAGGAPCTGNSTQQVMAGNSTYSEGPFSYPDLFDVKDKGEVRWVDVEVTPTTGSGGNGPATVNAGGFLAFFP